MTARKKGCPQCALHKLYRFIEPQILYYLTQNRVAYGYELIARLNEQPLSEGKVDHSAIYRTLRALEYHGNVTSDWDTNTSGPAKRKYKITDGGEEHLQEWLEAMAQLSGNLTLFTNEARSNLKKI